MVRPRSLSSKAAGMMPTIDALRHAASGLGIEAEPDSFDWETLRVRLLREGIKLKIPPELLHKKGMRSRKQSRALLEEVQADFHEATFRDEMAKLGESAKDLEASLSALKSGSGAKCCDKNRRLLRGAVMITVFSVQHTLQFNEAVSMVRGQGQ
eukprot:Skav201335  [mRNA]  locus=scaffold1389:192172:195160:+ [translate_table: standard]